MCLVIARSCSDYGANTISVGVLATLKVLSKAVRYAYMELV